MVAALSLGGLPARAAAQSADRLEAAEVAADAGDVEGAREYLRDWLLSDAATAPVIRDQQDEAVGPAPDFWTTAGGVVIFGHAVDPGQGRLVVQIGFTDETDGDLDLRQIEIRRRTGPDDLIGWQTSILSGQASLFAIETLWARTDPDRLRITET